MKKFALLFSIILFSLFTYSQNVAQQNTVARADYLGYSNGNHIFKLTNLQSCDVTMQYYFLSATGQKINILVPANGSVNISLAGAQFTTETIRAKANTFCPGVTRDASWIGVASTGAVLPIKFGKIYAARISINTVKLVFESEEDNTIKQYNITVSEDGKTFKRVNVVFPNGIVGNKTYSVLINL